ncbi:MAG: tRNA epoxyqueuosine(34) reductase QueG [Deltaproteobacteria bacterium]|nr:tRNA epoxyqueuosine(34) reductase QueG [Deltaproteobacteria bacterium]
MGDSQALAQAIRQAALDLGFDDAGLVPAGPTLTHGFYLDWLKDGLGGELTYLTRHAELKADPRRVAPWAQTVLMTARGYRPAAPRPEGNFSSRTARYAWGPDYHLDMRERLDRLGREVERLAGQPVRRRSFVDTAPLMEREWAARAGLGWVGKNGLLIHPRLGSYLFLGGVLLELPLPSAPGSGGFSRSAETPGASQADSRCGTCQACIAACPTGAITAPRRVDARRCIATPTIESKGLPPLELRPHMGDWVFGCDVCQEVCPWNRKAPSRHGPAEDPPELDRWLMLDPASFQQRYRHTPYGRPGAGGMARNAALALGNRLAAGGWDELSAGRGLTALLQALGRAEPVARGAAAWALGRACQARPEGRVAAQGLLAAALARESDPSARQEMEQALAVLKALGATA